MPETHTQNSYIQKFATQVNREHDLIGQLRANVTDPGVKGIVDQLWNNHTAMQQELNRMQQGS
jgi:hypothetical protein